MQQTFSKLVLVTALGLVATGCGGSNPSSADSSTADSPAASKLASQADVKASDDSAPSLKDGWSVYTSEEGRFSIAMPGTPDEESRPVALPDGSSVPLKIASLEKANVAYFTGFVDYPAGLVSNPNVNIQQILASSIEGATQSEFGDGDLKQQETSVSGIPCRNFETSGEVASTPARMKGIFCLEGDRLFEVLIIGEDTDAFPPKAQDFISSFEINNAS